MRSRLESAQVTLKNPSWAPELPSVMGCQYLLDFMAFMGMLMPGDMGSSTLTWQEINGFEKAMEIRLSPWEKRVLHTLSAAYFGELHAATKADRVAPWNEGKGRDEQQAIMAQRLKQAIRNIDNL